MLNLISWVVGLQKLIKDSYGRQISFFYILLWPVFSQRQSFPLRDRNTPICYTPLVPIWQLFILRFISAALWWIPQRWLPDAWEQTPYMGSCWYVVFPTWPGMRLLFWCSAIMGPNIWDMCFTDGTYESILHFQENSKFQFCFSSFVSVYFSQLDPISTTCKSDDFSYYFSWY